MKGKNIKHYSVLVFALSLSLLLANSYKGHVGIQMIIGAITALFYVWWGIMHHTSKGELHHKVVLEYVLIGVIAIALLLMLSL